MSAGSVGPETPEERAKKTAARYAIRMRPARIGQVLADLRPAMASSYATHAQAICQAEQAVRDVTNARGISQIWVASYMAFGRETYRLWRTLSGPMQDSEIEIARYKWEVRGLDPKVLAEVRDKVLATLDALPEEVRRKVSSGTDVHH